MRTICWFVYIGENAVASILPTTSFGVSKQALDVETNSLGSMLPTTSQSSNNVESLREKSSRRFPSYRTIMITGIVAFIIAAAISVPLLTLSPSKSITGASNANTSSNNASVTTAATIGGCFVAHSGTCCAGGSYCNMLHRTKCLFYFFLITYLRNSIASSQSCSQFSNPL